MIFLLECAIVAFMAACVYAIWKMAHTRWGGDDEGNGGGPPGGKGPKDAPIQPAPAGPSVFPNRIPDWMLNEQLPKVSLLMKKRQLRKSEKKPESPDVRNLRYEDSLWEVVD